ncbi:MAG: hypothetical protein OXN83_04040 [Oligoflexia bacterium]|nr:hypothetical protein [Oligoflexia bacterium]
MAQANESIARKCQAESQGVPVGERSNMIRACVKREKEKERQKQIQSLMENVITCSKNLKAKYNMTESTVESSESEEEEDSENSDNELTIVKLKEDCKKEKESAEECCSNPNSCNGMALDLVQHVAPLAPALLSAYKSYQISDDASKGHLTHQQTVDELCKAQNTASVGAFGTGLMSQLGPLFQKTCGKQIKKCKSACNSRMEAFKQDFMKCYSKILPNENILTMIRFAQKQCFDIADLKTETFEFDEREQFIENPKNNKCVFLPNENEGFVPASLGQSTPEESTALAWLLYVAKAYENTSKSGAGLSDNSDEEDIIDCGHQPNRVLAPSSNPSGSAPIPAPAFQICQQAVDYAVNETPPPMPGNNQANQPGNIQPAGALAGHTKSSNLSSLQVPSSEDCQYGVVDAAKLEECQIADGGLEEDFDTNKRPGLATKNIPSWQKGGSGSVGGSPGGGVPGAGSLAGNDSSREAGNTMYPYSGDMSAGANFSDNVSGALPYGASSGHPPHRKLAENSKDMNLEGMGVPPLAEENSGGEKSIFQMASDRIQNFCSDYSCE